MVYLDEGGRGRALTRVLAPPERLAPWVEYFFIQESRQAADRPWRIVCDPNPHILFAVESVEGKVEQARCIVVGSRPVYHDVNVAQRLYTLGARLRLPALNLLTRTNADEFAGRAFRTEDVLGSAGRALADRMSQDGPEAAIRHLSVFLEARLKAYVADARLEGALRSTRSVEDLARSMNLSLRSAHARAVEMTGLGPKRLLRITRLYRALHIAQSADTTWCATAYAAGYADQAHMVREFQSLLGEAPKEWRRRATADLFKIRARTAG